MTSSRRSLVVAAFLTSPGALPLAASACSKSAYSKNSHCVFASAGSVLISLDDNGAKVEYMPTKICGGPAMD